MITGQHKYDSEENQNYTDIANQIEVTYLKSNGKIFFHERDKLSDKFIKHINRRGLIISEATKSEIYEILNILADITFEK